MPRKKALPVNPEIPKVKEEAAIQTSITIYKKARGSKEVDEGDITQIQVGDAVSYLDPETNAQHTGRVEKVNVKAGVLRTEGATYGGYVIRKGKKLTFAEVISVSRKL